MGTCFARVCVCICYKLIIKLLKAALILRLSQLLLQLRTHVPYCNSFDLLKILCWFSSTKVLMLLMLGFGLITIAGRDVWENLYILFLVLHELRGCCRCWACALTVQNICHKFTFISGQKHTNLPPACPSAAAAAAADPRAPPHDADERVSAAAPAAPSALLVVDWLLVLSAAVVTNCGQGAAGAHTEGAGSGCSARQKTMHWTWRRCSWARERSAALEHELDPF